MIACTDTYYTDAGSSTAVVQFEDWNDVCALIESVHHRDLDAAEYVPGQFFRRELPCIVSAIEPIRHALDCIVIDGYVWLDSQNRQGLGAYLFDELGQSVPVIGVAKTRFAGSGGVEVFRGKSSRPLLVTAAGIEVSQAAQNIQAMAGSTRIPVLLKRADYLSRHG